MANQNKLKAYVRYDGTGRVIAGGPILQRFKPAVGNWVEINANECCNSIPTTTTTTTQGGGVTPTAWVGRITGELSSACDSGSNIWYTAGPIIDGHIVYQNADLTNPYTQNGIYISTAGYYYQLNEVGLATLIGPCPIVNQESAIGNFNSGDACSGIGTSLTVYYSGSLGNGTALFLDAGLTVPYSPGLFPSGNGIYLRLYFEAAYQVCTMSGNIIQSYTPCSSITTTTTTTSALFPVNVYFQGGSSTSNLCPPGSEGSGTITLYSTTPTVQVGSIVYSSNSTSTPLTFGGFYYKQVGESLVFYAPADNGVVVQFNC